MTDELAKVMIFRRNVRTVATACLGCGKGRVLCEGDREYNRQRCCITCDHDGITPDPYGWLSPDYDDGPAPDLKAIRAKASIGRGLAGIPDARQRDDLLDP